MPDTDTDVALVTGPDLVTLPCGCQIDQHTGSCWTPCAAIHGSHALARYFTSTGKRSKALARELARIQAHVAEQRVVVVGEQAVLL